MTVGPGRPEHGGRAMYRSNRIVVVTVAHDEEGRIGPTVRRVPREIVDEVLVVDDGSTDGTAREAREAGATVLRLERRSGVGSAGLHALAEARRGGCDVIVTIAGNDKDSPEEIPRLLDPIVRDGCDFVVGSRYLPGGSCQGSFPLHRRIGTRLHPLLVGLFAGRRITESTNGFRAFRPAVLDDPRIDLTQPWLGGYELEVYLLMRVLMLGYRTAEVPCTKRYRSDGRPHTRMRPVSDWWRMLRPVFLVGLRLRR